MAWDNINNFLRILLLTVVCSFAIYFLWMNEKSKKTRETFVTNVEQDYKESIVNVFRKTLNRDPQQFEIILYRSYMKTPFDTDYIQKQLVNSKEYALIKKAGINDPDPIEDKTKLDSSKLEKEKPTKLNDADLQMYRSIANVYEINLFRMPTSKEIDYYMNRMKKDKSFSLVKLEQILQMSEEYLILEKNQSNLVNADLKGNITDAQVTLIVNALYKGVYGVNPPLKIMDFLKGKYTEYKFDNVKFKKMLILLRDLENDRNANANSASASANNASANSASAKINSANANANSTNATGISVSAKVNSANANANSTNANSANANSAKANSANTSANNASANNASAKANNANANSASASANVNTPFGSSWNPTIKTQSKSCTKSPYDINKFYDSLYENNKNVNVEACINSSSTKGNSNDQQPFADRIIKRNDEELKYSCNRNSYSTQVDEELMSGRVNAYDKNVLPSQRNTRFGSFIADADDTKVGSIMPKFIYKEYN